MVFASVQAPGAKPQVKCLMEEGEKVEFIENYFTIPVSCYIDTIVNVHPSAFSISFVRLELNFIHLSYF